MVEPGPVTTGGTPPQQQSQAIRTEAGGLTAWEGWFCRRERRETEAARPRTDGGRPRAWSITRFQSVRTCQWE